MLLWLQCTGLEVWLIGFLGYKRGLLISLLPMRGKGRLMLGCARALSAVMAAARLVFQGF